MSYSGYSCPIRSLGVLGPRSSQSHGAALRYQQEIGHNFAIQLYPNFGDIFVALLNGSCTHAFIPIHNTLSGEISAMQKLLQQYNGSVEVIDRFSYPIRFCLLGIKSLDLRAVLSHPVAFRQCERFLRERLEWVERVEVESTGKAAEIVAERCDPTLGAIASPEAADDYKLKILAHGIQDVGYNVTTFALVAIADGNKNGNGGNRSGYDNKI